jgi:transposase-like protein
MATAIDRSEPGRKIPRYVGKGTGGTLTTEEARGLLEQQRRSGKSFKAFAQGLGLTASQLYWWRKKFGREVGSFVPEAARRVPFVPVVVRGPAGTSAVAPSTATPAKPFVLSWSAERSLQIPADFSETSLRTLLGILREAP